MAARQCENSTLIRVLRHTVSALLQAELRSNPLVAAARSLERARAEVDAGAADVGMEAGPTPGAAAKLQLLVVREAVLKSMSE